MAEREDLLDFNALVIVSGDGLCFEVCHSKNAILIALVKIVNSIVLRKDAAKIFEQLAFAIVPCGSGNGLLSSVFSYRQ